MNVYLCVSVCKRESVYVCVSNFFFYLFFSFLGVDCCFIVRLVSSMVGRVLQLSIPRSTVIILTLEGQEHQRGR